MAAQNAKIVDLKAYREARSRNVGGSSRAEAPAAVSPAVMALNGMQPVMVWVPVWTFVPVMASPWVHAQ